MQELMFVGPKRIEFRERPAPRIGGPHQALIRPLAVARCDLDLGIANGSVPAEGPFPLGHECVGEVVEVGEMVRTIRVKDRVIVPFQINCGSCARCRIGQTAHCESVRRLSAYGLGPFGGGDFGGALADRLLVPFADAMLIALPPGLDPVHAAALGDNAVDGFRTVHAALAGAPGSSVLVAGGGGLSIALYAVSAALASGAGEVVYVDASEERTHIAERLGAKIVREQPNPRLRVGRFPIVVDATSHEAGLRFCLASTEREGTVTSVALYFNDVPFPLFELYTRGVTFKTGRVHARKELPEAVALAASGAYALAPIVTMRADWKEAAEAWMEPTTKLVVTREAA